MNWIVPDLIAATALPSARDLRRLREAGVTLLVSVVPELPDLDEVERADMRHLHLPVDYMSAPSRQQIRKFVSAVEAELRRGGKVAVHCIGGFGRTGTVIACYLVSQGTDPREAISLVRRQRPGSIESEEQVEAVFAWAAAQAAVRSVAAPSAGDDGDAAQEADTRIGDSELTPAAQQETWLRKEGTAKMARERATGYLRWGDNGSAVDVRSLPSAPGGGPKVEDLKGALRTFRADNEVTVTLTETLGEETEAWITVACPPGKQAGLLIATGQIVDLLVRGGVYEEVLLSGL